MDRTSRISLSGAIDLSRLNDLLPPNRFRYSTHSTDPYHMGYETIDTDWKLGITLDRIRHFTAEAASSLAMILHRLSASRPEAVVLQAKGSAEQWVERLGLRNITGHSDANAEPSVIGRYGLLPVLRINIRNARECAVLAERATLSITKLLDRNNIEPNPTLVEAMRLVLQEGIANVFEHAYPGARERNVFIGATVSPPPLRTDRRRRSLAYRTVSEETWYLQQDDQNFLEIAICDGGVNLPSTLWKAYQQVRPERFTNLALGSTAGLLARSRLHHDIARWAFDHRSTRKADAEFPDEWSKHNWRGLHRALNLIAGIRGCIILRTGQARVGFAFSDHVTREMEAAEAIQREFPGTSLVLRIGRTISPTRTVIGSAGITPLELSAVAPVAPSLLSTVNSFPPGNTSYVGLPFCFEHITAPDYIFGLLAQLRFNIVPVLLCCSLSEECASGLVNFGSVDPNDLGPPRLLGVCAANGTLRWYFVGTIPETAKSFISQLSEFYFADIPSDRDGNNECLANQLARHYGEIFSHETGSIAIARRFRTLSESTLAATAQSAFEAFCEVENNWIYGKPDVAIRLPSGALVSGYISVFEMLQNNRTLADYVGSCVVRCFEREKKNSPLLRLVALTCSR